MAVISFSNHMPSCRRAKENSQVRILVGLTLYILRPLSKIGVRVRIAAFCAIEVIAFTLTPIFRDCHGVVTLAPARRALSLVQSGPLGGACPTVQGSPAATAHVARRVAAPFF